MQELRRPAADVLKDLVQVAKEPRLQPPQVPLPVRERLLMISVGYRLTQLEDLLTLLPLTAVPDYVQWFTLIAHHICGHGGTSAELHEHNGVMKRVLGDESPISAAPLAGFKVGRGFSQRVLGDESPISAALLAGFKVGRGFYR